MTFSVLMPRVDEVHCGCLGRRREPADLMAPFKFFELK
jgi:hypothetical protein